MNTRTSIVWIFTSVLAGCSTSWLPWSTSFEGPKGAYTPPGATAYSCEGSKRLLVRFESGGKSGWAIYPDREIRLDRVTSASGEEFSRAGTTLAIRDGEATLTEGNAVQFARCKPEAK